MLGVEGLGFRGCRGFEDEAQVLGSTGVKV